MKADKADSQDRIRVLALSSTAAGGVLILFLLDYFHFAQIDSSFAFMLMMSGSKNYAKVHLASKIVWSLLAIVWLLATLQAWRHGGRRGTAFVGVGILVLGMILIAVAQIYVNNCCLDRL